MATFPAIRPSTRTYSPGEYPHTPFQAMTGTQSRVRHSSSMVNSQVRLTFTAITEAEMLEILAHYNGERGGFTPFGLPEITWSSTDNVNDYTLPGDAWIYAEPPEVEDFMCGDHAVTVVLSSVPGEGAGLLGINAVIAVLLAVGKAAVSNGANLSITLSLEVDAGFSPGVAQSVTASATYGTATGGTGATVAGILAAVGWNLDRGSPLANLGKAYKVTASLAPGWVSQDPDFGSVQLLIHGQSIVDSSLVARSLTLSGSIATTTSEPRFGSNSILFDGTDDRIAMAAGSFTVAAPYTRELWFWTNSVSKTQTLFYFSSVSWVRITDTGKISARIAGFGPYTTTAGIQANRWTHLRITGDGSVDRIFIDGVLDTTINIAFANVGIFEIGAGSASDYFDGKMAEIRVSGVARSTAGFSVPLESFPDGTRVIHAGPFGITRTVTVSATYGAASSP